MFGLAGQPFFRGPLTCSTIPWARFPVHKSNPPRTQGTLVFCRGLRKGKAPKKPKLQFKQKPTGEIVYPTTIHGLNPDEVEAYNRWLKKRVAEAQELLGTGMGDRFKQEVNREIKGRFETMWGILKAAIKERAKNKKLFKRKRRRLADFHKRIEKWNSLEDAKENKILRDKERAIREENRVAFSFKKFLAEDREKKREPYVIEDEETFRNTLKEDMKKFLWKKPKAVRRIVHPRNTLGYRKRAEKEILAPFLLEVRRRARIAELVEKREEAIAETKWRKTVEERRQKTFEERHARLLEQQQTWNEAMGKWHEQGNTYRLKKLEFWNETQRVQKESRLEFLKALNETVDMWVRSPTECRFNRFRFAVPFPYNKTEYL